MNIFIKLIWFVAFAGVFVGMIKNITSKNEEVPIDKTAYLLLASAVAGKIVFS